MNAALQKAICQELQCVSDVDGDAAVVGLHPLPAALCSADLKGRDRLTEEKRQASEIGVALDPNIVELGVGCSVTRMIFHISQVTIRNCLIVAMTSGEVVFGEL